MERDTGTVWVGHLRLPKLPGITYKYQWYGRADLVITIICEGEEGPRCIFVQLKATSDPHRVRQHDGHVARCTAP